jgi:acyl-CoA dehydrogenase
MSGPGLKNSPAALSVLADDRGLGELRRRVRAFLDEERDAGRLPPPGCDRWLSGWDPGFSRRLAARGWVGMLVPRDYGGPGAAPFERYVVTEELLAAGAPVAAHWVADRQIAPTLLRFGTDAQKARFLPEIVQGRCYFAIGMSEPESGSDLASVRTRAERVPGGWKVTGTKLWSSGAHHAHWSVMLVRTSDRPDPKSRLSQLIVDLRAPGATISPITSMTGEHHFNEIHLDSVLVPDAMLLGREGEGWPQVTAELAFERGGPERVLSSAPLLLSTFLAAPRRSDPAMMGQLMARLIALREAAFSVSRSLGDNRSNPVDAAIIKHLGTRFEQEVVDACRLLLPETADLDAPPGSRSRLLAEGIMHSPGFTLRGGTSEILRGIIARSLYSSPRAGGKLTA